MYDMSFLWSHVVVLLVHALPFCIFVAWDNGMATIVDPPNGENPDDKNPQTIWTFGFGSNMNIELLRSKKGIVVLDSTPATVRGWRLNFSFAAISLVEPSFADAQPGCVDDLIHGVAVQFPVDSYTKLCKQEAAYKDAEVAIESYDGRTFVGRIFSKPNGNLDAPDIPCSKRYLNVLVQGATDVKLNPDYIAAPNLRHLDESLAKTKAPKPVLAPSYNG